MDHKSLRSKIIYGLILFYNKNCNGTSVSTIRIVGARGSSPSFVVVILLGIMYPNLSRNNVSSNPGSKRDIDTDYVVEIEKLKANTSVGKKKELLRPHRSYL